ncbi:MAG: hypothetical protein K1X94_18810 [Sandaracinaceae bacterium]|nr:hypothetical protein [Sandaracinaceae bacterium]
MTRILGLYTQLVHAIIELLLPLALALDRHERWAVKTAKRLRGSLARRGGDGRHRAASPTTDPARASAVESHAARDA